MLQHHPVVVHYRVGLGDVLLPGGELVLNHVGRQVAYLRHLLERAQQLGQPVIGKANHVVVQLYDVVAAGLPHSQGHAVQAHVLRMVDDAHLGVRRGDLVQILLGAVGGAVVPDQDLVIVPVGGLEERSQTLPQHAQAIPGDQENGDFRHGRRVVSLEAPGKARVDTTVPPRHRPVAERTRRGLERRRDHPPQADRTLPQQRDALGLQAHSFVEPRFSTYAFAACTWWGA